MKNTRKLMAKLINWEIEKRKIKITNKRDYVVTNE